MHKFRLFLCRVFHHESMYRKEKVKRTSYTQKAFSINEIASCRSQTVDKHDTRALGIDYNLIHIVHVFMHAVTTVSHVSLLTATC
jgi:hypothetical protein